MALELQPPDGRRRVKVYELRDNDWFDRGTGFCTGQILGVSCRVLCAYRGRAMFHRAQSRAHHHHRQ